ncbi:hypothetical protein ARMGADRAFT_1037603 [Armillaria gallica]|uniref:Uncharacterized protein n=1 Tax=Armillaria gallica TaxID=47427 RepID=A0A2H3CZ47_ARMGA|nr:hypothetical protein ARMGADRAFT_1037603 [Armillaria gallica]
MSGRNTRSAMSASTDRRDLPDDAERSTKQLKLIGLTNASSLPSPSSSPVKTSSNSGHPPPSVTNELDSEGTVSNSDSPVPDDPVDALSTSSDLPPGPDIDVESQSGLPIASTAEHDIRVVAPVAVPHVQSFFFKPSSARRIFNMAVHLEGYNMVNLFAADPRLYHTAGYGDSKHVLAKDKVKPTFFMIGHVTHSSLFDGMFSCEINIQPLAHTWPCQHAMLTQMLELNHVVMSSYKSGIQFSTSRKPMSGRREIQPKSVPMDVPVFRGVQPFQLLEYTRLMMEYDKLSEGNFVIMAFTVAAYKSKKKFNLASLNLQFVIYVSEYGLDDTVEGPEPLLAYLVNETPLGMDKMVVMEVPVKELVFDSKVMVLGSEGMAMI